LTDSFFQEMGYMTLHLPVCVSWVEGVVCYLCSWLPGIRISTNM